MGMFDYLTNKALPRKRKEDGPALSEDEKKEKAALQSKIEEHLEDKDVRQFRYKTGFTPEMRAELEKKINMEEKKDVQLPGPGDQCFEGKGGFRCRGKDATMRCSTCIQFYCVRHARPNKHGLVGGHSNCEGKNCQAIIGSCTKGADEEGKNKICEKCKFTFCTKHTREHYCDVGCSTSYIYKGKCTGSNEALDACKLCNAYYCKHHIKPVETIVSRKAKSGEGGHVCCDYTGGAVLFGDSFGDVFELAFNVSVTAASGGSYPGTYFILVGRTCKIAVLKAIEMYQLEALKPMAMQVIDMVQNALKGEAQVSNYSDELVSDENLRKIVGYMKSASVAMKFVNDKISDVVPHWLIFICDSAESFEKNYEVIRDAVKHLIKISYIVTEILSLIFHIDKACKGDPMAALEVFHDGKRVMHDLAKAFGLDDKPRPEVIKGGKAIKQSIELLVADKEQMRESKNETTATYSDDPVMKLDSLKLDFLSIHSQYESTIRKMQGNREQLIIDQQREVRNLVQQIEFLEEEKCTSSEVSTAGASEQKQGSNNGTTLERYTAQKHGPNRQDAQKHGTTRRAAQERGTTRRAAQQRGTNRHAAEEELFWC